MKLILIFIILISASCHNDNEFKPVDIHYGQDICERCKMIISEEKFSSQIVLSNGDVYNFDDIGGMLVYISENKINPERERIYVKDFDTNKWLTSDEAVYIRLEKLNTPMNFGIIAVSGKNSVKEIKSKYDGEFLGKFSDALELLRIDTN